MSVKSKVYPQIDGYLEGLQFTCGASYLDLVFYNILQKDRYSILCPRNVNFCNCIVCNRASKWAFILSIVIFAPQSFGHPPNPPEISPCSCKNVNYARRTHCHRCKVERKDAKKATSFDKKKLGSEIGKNAAEKSRGLFSAEDWQCTQCANVNWSRRQTCNMCNAPKFNEVEERTGED